MGLEQPADGKPFAEHANSRQGTEQSSLELKVNDIHPGSLVIGRG